MRRRSLLVLLVLAALAAVPAAFAGHVKKSDTSLSLVAYSIPTNVYPKLFSAYQATPQGQGVKFTSSFAASEVQSKAVAAGLPADVVNFSISTDMDRLVQSKLVDKSWSANPQHGIVSKLRRRLRAAQRQPEAHQAPGTTWSSPACRSSSRTRSAPAAPAGTSWPPTASQLREHKTPKQAQAYLTQLFHNNVSQDTQRPQRAEHVPVGQGRRAARLRERREARAVAGQARLLPDPEGDAADRDAARRRERLATRRPRSSSSTGCTRRQRRTSGPRTATAPSCPASRSTTPRASRPGRSCSRSSYVGGWDKVNTQFFDPTNGIIAKIEQGLGVSTG